MNLLGLDFGTSNTVCAVNINGKSSLVKLEKQATSIPSTVFFPFDNLSNPVYGERATFLYTNGGYGRYMKSFKRIIGSEFFESGTMLEPGKKIKFHKLIVDYFKFIKKQTELFTGKEIDYVVVGKPIKLSHIKNESEVGILQLENILKDVGFRNFSFLEEPIAAALYHKKKISKKGNLLIADLGGGTCDFSVVTINENSSNSFNIRSTSGVVIGGTDLDSAFALNVFFERLGYKTIDKYKGLLLPDTLYRLASDWNKITTSLYTPKSDIVVRKMISLAKEKDKILKLKNLIDNKKAHQLLSSIESCKIKLSYENETVFSDGNLGSSELFTVNVGELNYSIKDLITRILGSAQECVAKAKITSDDIDFLILTGGTSKLPILRENLQNIYNKAELIDDNTMDSVALGLLEKAKTDKGL